MKALISIILGLIVFTSCSNKSRRVYFRAHALADGAVTQIIMTDSAHRPGDIIDDAGVDYQYTTYRLEERVK